MDSRWAMCVLHEYNAPDRENHSIWFHKSIWVLKKVCWSATNIVHKSDDDLWEEQKDRRSRIGSERSRIYTEIRETNQDKQSFEITLQV